MKKKNFGWLTAISTLMVLILLILGALPVAAQQNDADETLKLEASASPATAAIGNEITVKLTLTSLDKICDPVITRRPLDIMLVLDASGSMYNTLDEGYEGSSLEAASNAILKFLTLTDAAQDRVGLVSFSDSSQLDAKLGMTDAVNSVIQGHNFVSSGGTNIYSGMQDAIKELAANGRPEASHVIILLSDGGQNVGGDANVVATQAKQAGVKAVSIGLGIWIDELLLRSIASSNSDYYYAPQASDLPAIYESIAKSIQVFDIARDVRVDYQFDHTNFDLVEDSISPAATTSVDKVTWTIPAITGGQQQLVAKIKPRAPGNFKAIKAVDLAYLACGKTSASMHLDEGYPIMVMRNLEDKDTACNAAQSSGTGNAFLGTICQRFPWFLIGSLLVGLGLLALWLKDHWNELKDYFRCRFPMSGCPWIKLAFYISLALLSGALLSTLSRVACASQDWILFWRKLPDRSSAYFIKSINPDLSPRPLTSIVNEKDQVSFFSPNDAAQQIVGVSGGIDYLLKAYDYNGTPISFSKISGAYPAWSPDGSKMAFSKNNEDIYIYERDTGEIVPLAGASQPGVIETMPAWSADGARIAFVRTSVSISSANVQTAINVPCDIWTVAAEGGNPTIMPGASGVGFNYQPAYSPDGKWLAFVHHTTGTSTNEDPKAEILLVPAEGGAPHTITANYASDGSPIVDAGNTWPTWGGDGSTLMFSSRRCGKQYDLFTTTINPDGDSGKAVLMASVSDPNAFEFGAQQAQFAPFTSLRQFLNLWPWLIPALILGLLTYLAFKPKKAKNILDYVNFRYVWDTTDTTLKQGVEYKMNVFVSGKKGFGLKKLIRQVDVALVLDCSGSMDTKDAGVLQTRLGAAKKASTHFARCVLSKDDRVGLVSFSNDAKVVQDLTNDYQMVEKAVQDLQIEGTTNLRAGIIKATEMLSRGGRAGIKKVMLILSDGQPTTENQDEVQLAKKARDLGIRIFTIGTGEANADLLKNIADDETNYRHVSNYDDLEKTFVEAARYLKTLVVGRNVVYTHKYDAQKYNLNTGYIIPRPDSVSEGEIEWKYDEILEAKEKGFQYKVTPFAEAGKHDLVKPGLIAFDR